MEGASHQHNHRIDRSMGEKAEEHVLEFKKALTSRVYLCILFGAIVICPAIIASILIVGTSLGGGGPGIAIGFTGFVTAYFFSELAHLGGRDLTKQETFLIWSTAGAASSGGAIFLTIILKNAYMRSLCPITWSFNVPGTQIPLPLGMPNWFAPPPTSTAYIQRALLHPDFAIPIILLLITQFIESLIISPCLGLLAYQLFFVEERLPFPASQIAAETATVLSEREPGRLRMFTVCALVGIGYASILYLIPFLTNWTLIAIPIPWVDLTSLIEPYFPAASFGFATSLSSFAIGLMLPLNVIASFLLGSAAVFLVGNPMAYKAGLFTDWTPGMDISSIFQRSTLQVWVFPGIGLTIAAALVPLVKRASALKRAFTSLAKLSKPMKASGIPPLPILLGLFLGASLVNILIISQLTSFPLIIIAALALGWSFLGSMVSAYLIGVSGFSMSVPYVNEAVYIASGYQGIDVWVLPTFSTIGGGGAAASFAMCAYTETRLTDWWKSHLIAAPISWLMGLIYVQLFWSMNPIPSPMYRATEIYWPIDVIVRSLWITGGIKVGGAPMMIGSAFIIGSVLSALSEFTPIPFSFIAAIGGFYTYIPIAVTSFLGAIVAKIIQFRFGREFWRRYRVVIASGLILGEAITLTLGVSYLMISKSLWILPY